MTEQPPFPFNPVPAETEPPKRKRRQVKKQSAPKPQNGAPKRRPGRPRTAPTANVAVIKPVPTWDAIFNAVDVLRQLPIGERKRLLALI